MVAVELISKEECHLCDEALDVLKRVQADTAFELTIRKLREGDPDFEEYKIRFPVVLINGQFAFQYRVPEKLLRQKLRGMA